MKVFILFAIFLVAGIFAIKQSKIFNRSLETSTAPILSPINTLPKTQTKEVHSPDGTLKVIMSIEKKKEGERIYSFSIADISGKSKRFLLTKTLEPKDVMLIPQNSFSPDNTYLFLEEAKAGSLDILVFKTSVEPFAKGEQYLSLGSLLTQTKPGYSLKSVTGWVSPIFLQIYTTQTGSKPYSTYWFSPETKAFIAQ